MKGLLLKDLLNLRQQMKTYFFIIAVWLVITVLNGSSSSFFSGLMMMLIIMIPLTAISYDERAKWDRYALTMPVTRLDIIFSKYILMLIVAAVAALISVAVNLFMKQELMDAITVPVVCMLLGITMASVTIPIIFKFGAEKGRTTMILVMLIPMILIFAAAKFGLFDRAAVMLNLAWVIPIAALAVLAGSVMVSLRIYKKKEF